jgi:hypothetical protein
MCRRTLTIACALVVMTAGVASAQRPRQPAPSVHRMDIYNGPRLTVAYFGRNLPPSDRALLRELAVAQSDPLPVMIVPIAEMEQIEAIPVPVTAPAAPAEDPFLLRDARLALATARVAGSPRLRWAFGLADVPSGNLRQPTPNVRPAVDGDDAPAPTFVVTMRDGKRILCSEMEESGIWVLATTTQGKKVRLRATEISRIEEPRRR